MRAYCHRFIRKILCLRLSARFLPGSAGSKTIFLTFDDGPHRTHTVELLELLKAFDAKATFFLVGDQILLGRDIVTQIVADGHFLGNHSFSHRVLTGISPDTLSQEILRCQELLEEFQTGPIRLFRPPQGLLGIHGLLYLRENRLIPCLWTVDSTDSLFPSPSAIVKKLIDSSGNGSVILFHDDADLCLKALRVLLPYWKSEGYQLRSLAHFHK